MAYRGRAGVWEVLLAGSGIQREGWAAGVWEVLLAGSGIQQWYGRFYLPPTLFTACFFNTMNTTTLLTSLGEGGGM